MDKAIICDLDGTLALFGDNNPYERDCSQDELNKPVAFVVRLLKENGISVIIVSGRYNKYLDKTIEWLRKHEINYDSIYMPRGDLDHRKDVKLKKEIYDNHIKDKYEILFALDDRNQVVEFWRELGITVFQVADGNF